MIYKRNRNHRSPDYVKRSFAIACVGLVLAACGNGGDEYSEEQCNELAQNLADAKSELNSYDRSTALGQTFYDGHSENVVRPLEIALAGSCAEYVAQETATPVEESPPQSERNCVMPAPSANLAGCILFEADFGGADLSGVDLSGAFVAKADLSDANLEDALLAGASLSEANLSEANLFNADLRGANLAFANLTGANLTGANFQGASLGGANLTDANLTGANLPGAILLDARLNGARLNGARLNGAYLNNADLSDADLTDADLDGAILDGVIGYRP